MTTRTLCAMLLTLLLALTSTEAPAQTCSCAGAPLIGSQSVSSASQGNLLTGLTYQYHEISDLYSGSSELANRSVERNTQSVLLEFNYGLTDRLTLSGTATFVRKYRNGLREDGRDRELAAGGIGDGMLMLKYVLHKNTIREQYQLAAGGGVKAPLGASSIRQNGIALNMDMQPGTGAWDGLFWSYFSKTFAPTTTLNTFLYSTYRVTGAADRFGSDDRYRFGNEWVVNAGVTDDLAGDLSYIARVKYRSAASHERNGQVLPNTGGKWIYLSPALQYGVSRRISVKLSGEIPLYQDLNGIQSTTTYSASISLFYNFGGQIIF